MCQLRSYVELSVVVVDANRLHSSHASWNEMRAICLEQHAPNAVEWSSADMNQNLRSCRDASAESAK
jgi:hypothetical protein